MLQSQAINIDGLKGYTVPEDYKTGAVRLDKKEITLNNLPVILDSLESRGVIPFSVEDKEFLAVKNNTLINLIEPNRRNLILDDAQYNSNALNITGLSLQSIQERIQGYTVNSTQPTVMRGLFPVLTAASFESQEYRVHYKELIGAVGEYSDRKDLPNATVIDSVETRQIYRVGARVDYGHLEKLTYARLGEGGDILQQKMNAQMRAFRINEDWVLSFGIKGYRIYGQINEPKLNPILPFPLAGAFQNSTGYNNLSFGGAISFITFALMQLQIQMDAYFDMGTTPVEIHYPPVLAQGLHNFPVQYPITSTKPFFKELYGDSLKWVKNPNMAKAITETGTAGARVDTPNSIYTPRFDPKTGVESTNLDMIMVMAQGMHDPYDLSVGPKFSIFGVTPTAVMTIGTSIGERVKGMTLAQSLGGMFNRVSIPITRVSAGYNSGTYNIIV